ncbi:MAG: inositol monophosphatase family protein, partial [Nocardioides sp.]
STREHATFACGGLHEVPSAAARTALVSTATSFRRAWGWGNFWGHILVAQGAVEAALSHGTMLWDTAAPALVVAESGGRWSDISGRAGLDNGSLLTSNGPLHDDLVRDLELAADTVADPEP